MSELAGASFRGSARSCRCTRRRSYPNSSLPSASCPCSERPKSGSRKACLCPNNTARRPCTAGRSGRSRRGTRSSKLSWNCRCRFRKGILRPSRSTPRQPAIPLKSFPRYLRRSRGRLPLPPNFLHRHSLFQMSFLRRRLPQLKHLRRHWLLQLSFLQRRRYCSHRRELGSGKSRPRTRVVCSSSASD